MNIHSFLYGVASVLMVETIALMIATAWLKKRTNIEHNLNERRCNTLWV